MGPHLSSSCLKPALPTLGSVTRITRSDCRISPRLPLSPPCCPQWPHPFCCPFPALTCHWQLTMHATMTQPCDGINPKKWCSCVAQRSGLLEEQVHWSSLETSDAPVVSQQLRQLVYKHLDNEISFILPTCKPLCCPPCAEAELLPAGRIEELVDLLDTLWEGWRKRDSAPWKHALLTSTLKLYLVYISFISYNHCCWVPPCLCIIIKIGIPPYHVFICSRGWRTERVRGYQGVGN
jgi:hypothetical protein